jgi:CHAT domain-containing protein
MQYLTDWNSTFARLGPPTGRTPKERGNPLTRCGIALSGANHAKEISKAIAEDGVPTGLEASLLDLQGRELVILSACDSGAGEVKIGEGVMFGPRLSHRQRGDRAGESLEGERQGYKSVDDGIHASLARR